MCGRFNVESDPLSRLLLELVRLRHPGPDNYNAAPTETITVLRLDDDGEPELVPMRWWLTPHWAKQVDTRYAMFNARAESVERSPAFREPFKARRCVVPVSGFYEWARLQEPSSDGKRKMPYYIHPREHAGMLLAGIWDRWHDPDGSGDLESFAVLTTDAAPGLEFIHKRQPVMLPLTAARTWLDPATAVDELKPLLAPAIPQALDALPVSTYVNNARHKDSRCLEGVAAPVAVDP
ncbi:MAG: SOS response-associated peptidase [Gammaproteobacteria bacterium]|nr:SOS response-associated peptidase [Gammaproteobacteria bacterium]